MHVFGHGARHCCVNVLYEGNVGSENKAIKDDWFGWTTFANACKTLE